LIHLVYGKMDSMKNLLFKGVIVPLVTPLVEPDVPDIGHLCGLIDHVSKKQVDGIFILGTTGEGLALSYSTRQHIIEQSCRYIKQQGKVKVFVGIINTPLSDAVSLADIATDNGADGIVLASPFMPISQEALLEYTINFTRECSSAICLYNRPNQTEIAFRIQTIKQLLLIDNIVAIKDSSADLNYFKELIQLKKIRQDWAVLMGIEELLAKAVTDGADGGVAGGANLFPDLYVNLYHAAINKKKSEIEHYQKIVETVAEHIYKPEYLAGLKYALSCKQLCKEILTEPPFVAGLGQQKKIRQFLENFNNYCLKG
jgi:dihydrodipicolinate synthase/N-acetylneuraminate lyase